MKLLIGADIGTTNCKACLFDLDGNLIDIESRAYQRMKKSGISSEGDAFEWLNLFYDCVRCLYTKASTMDPEAEIEAISLSTQGGTLICTDRNYVPTRSALIWDDSTCNEEVEELTQAGLADMIFKNSGWRLTPSAMAAQILRIQHKEKDVFDRTAFFLSVPDFFAAHLTGEPRIDLSNAGITRLANIHTKTWNAILLDRLSITEDQLATITESGEVVGWLTEAAAEKMGLTTDCILVAGGHDQYCAALGAGATHCGDAFLATGTAWVVASINDCPTEGFSTSRHTVKGLWGSLISHRSGGSSLEWFRKNLGVSEENKESFETINRQIEGIDTGDLLFYPFFSGSTFPVSDPFVRATFLGLSTDHTRYHLCKAIMEGVCAQAAWMLDTLGEKPKRILMTGGATYSTIWTQIMADFCDCEVIIPKAPEAGCVGAGILAAIATGAFTDIITASNQFGHGRTVVVPDDKKDYYQRKKEKYIAGYEKIYGCNRN